MIGGLEIVILIVGALFIIFWIAALISIIRNEFPGEHDRLIWILLVIFVPFIGTILYFAIGRNKRIKTNQVSNGIVQ
jgi:threonine/homoserine/homoserine lactone efflux protein